jgi:CheY-like chemotaxis protein
MTASSAALDREPLGRVLIVEDDDAVSSSLAEVLRDDGYQANIARDGQQAIDWLRANPAPHIILLDLWMPNVTGEEFRQLQLADEALKHIPVVVISAAADARARGRVMKVEGVLQKPINLEQLLTFIEKHTGQ